MSKVYLLSSDDVQLKKERTEELMLEGRKLYQDANFMLFTSDDFKGNNFAKLENELMDPGLFAQNSIIKIYLNDFDKLATEIFALIIKYYREGLFIIVDLPRIVYSYAKLTAKEYTEPKKGAKSVALETKRKQLISGLLYLQAKLIYLYSPEGNDLYNYISRLALKYGLQPDNNCIKFIADSASGNLVAVDQLLRQLSFLDNKHIKEEDIAKIFSLDSRYYGSDFVDALLSGDSYKALSILSSLHDEMNKSGLNPLILLINQLCTCMEVIYLGKLSPMANCNELFLKHGIKMPKTKEALERAITKMPYKLVTYLSLSTAKISNLIAHFHFDEAYYELQTLSCVMSNFNAMKLKPLL